MGKTAITHAQSNYENPPRRVGKLYEVVDGKFVEPKAMGAAQTRIAVSLCMALTSFLKETKLGAADAEMLFLLRSNPRLERRPDVSYVSFERWPAERLVPETGAWDVIPELAVEVISPSNSASEVLDKLFEYFEAGVKRIWVVYPRKRIVHDYASLDEIHVLRGEASLEGGEILPGFSIKLVDLFQGI
jgi:Uma2 family endonuclease